VFRFAFAAVLLECFAFSAPAAPPVYKGYIKDVRGTDGSLTLTLGEGKNAKDQTFPIPGARIVGLSGNEGKVGDLLEGDWVEVLMTADGKTVQEIRLLPPPKIK
jgi:hypothetical protein